MRLLRPALAVLALLAALPAAAGAEVQRIGVDGARDLLDPGVEVRVADAAGGTACLQFGDGGQCTPPGSGLSASRVTRPEGVRCGPEGCTPAGPDVAHIAFTDLQRPSSRCFTLTVRNPRAAARTVSGFFRDPDGSARTWGPRTLAPGEEAAIGTTPPGPCVLPPPGGGPGGGAAGAVTGAPPVAVDDAFTAVATRRFDANVLLNDRDPEGGPLTAELLGGSFPADWSPLAPDGAFGFTAPESAALFGQHTVIYRAVDRAGLKSAPALAVVSVLPLPRDPVVQPPCPRPRLVRQGAQVLVTGGACTNRNPDATRFLGLAVTEDARHLRAPVLRGCLPFPSGAPVLSDAALRDALARTTVLYDAGPGGAAPPWPARITAGDASVLVCEIKLAPAPGGGWRLLASSDSVDRTRLVSAVTLRRTGRRLAGRIGLHLFGALQRAPQASDLPRVVVERRAGRRWRAHRRLTLTGVAFSVGAPRGVYRARVLTDQRTEGATSAVVRVR